MIHSDPMSSDYPLDLFTNPNLPPGVNDLDLCGPPPDDDGTAAYDAADEQMHRDKENLRDEDII